MSNKFAAMVFANEILVGTAQATETLTFATSSPPQPGRA